MKCAIFLNFRGLIFCDGLMRMAFSWAWLARAAFCLIITMTSASIALIVSTSTFAIPPIFPFIFFPLLPSFFSTIIISLALFSTPPKDRTSPSRQIAHPPPHLFKLSHHTLLLLLHSLLLFLLSFLLLDFFL